jgi:hypothetical protein
MYGIKWLSSNEALKNVVKYPRDWFILSFIKDLFRICGRVVVVTKLRNGYRRNHDSIPAEM